MRLPVEKKVAVLALPAPALVTAAVGAAAAAHSAYSHYGMQHRAQVTVLACLRCAAPTECALGPLLRCTLAACCLCCTAAQAHAASVGPAVSSVSLPAPIWLACWTAQACSTEPPVPQAARYHTAPLASAGWLGCCNLSLSLSLSLSLCPAFFTASCQLSVKVRSTAIADAFI